MLNIAAEVDCQGPVTLTDLGLWVAIIQRSVPRKASALLAVIRIFLTVVANCHKLENLTAVLSRSTVLLSYWVAKVKKAVAPSKVLALSNIFD